MFLEIFASFAALCLAVSPQTSNNTFDYLNFDGGASIQLTQTSTTFYVNDVSANNIYYNPTTYVGDRGWYNIDTPDLSSPMFGFYLYDDGETSGRLNFTCFNYLSYNEGGNECNLKIYTSIRFHIGTGTSTTYYWYRDVLNYTYPYYVYDSYKVFQNQGMQYPSIGYTVYDLSNLYFDFSVTLIPMDYAEYNNYILNNETAYDDGYAVGYHDGEISGYNDGVSDSGNYTFARLFGAIADTPIMIMRKLLSFNVFGVSALQIFMGMFTGVIVLFVFRRLVGSF